MKFKNIFFDFNGTIINDVDLCISLLNEMLLNKNHPIIERDEYFNIFTFPIIEYYKKAGFTFENYSFEELANYFIKKYQPSSFHCELYPGLIDLFDYLNENKVNLYILSASQKNNLIEQINHFKISKYFKDVLGIENIYAKSKLDIAKDYFDENQLNPKETLFIGDTVHDYEIAKELNANCYLMTLGHQSKNVLSKTGCKLFDSYFELKEYL